MDRNLIPSAFGKPADRMSPIYPDVPAPQNHTSLIPICSIQLLYFSAQKSLAQERQMPALHGFLPRDGIVDLVNKGFHEVLVTFESVDGLSGSSPKSSVVLRTTKP